MAAVGTGPRGELFRSRAGLRLDHENIGVVGAVGIGILVADERDPLAIRRPLGVVLVHVLAGGQLLGFLRGEVPQVKSVVGVVAKIALDVLLEVVAIDHDRAWAARAACLPQDRARLWGAG